MRLTADMITADEYFEHNLGEFAGYELRFRSNGTFLESCCEDLTRSGTIFNAVPLFNDISGYSPVGTDYRKLGCSFHSKDIANVQKILLNS